MDVETTFKRSLPFCFEICQPRQPSKQLFVIDATTAYVVPLRAQACQGRTAGQ
jgi:hypothetical protein